MKYEVLVDTGRASAKVFKFKMYIETYHLNPTTWPSAKV
jgi:hypothetical protein